MRRDDDTHRFTMRGAKQLFSPKRPLPRNGNDLFDTSFARDQKITLVFFGCPGTNGSPYLEPPFQPAKHS